MKKEPMPTTPLAERIRPQLLEGFIGQEHLMGEDKPLRRMLESGHLQSLIFWGPPGSGKTTLARMISARLHAHFYEISAIAAGIKEIRQVIEQARAHAPEPTILFIDEIHRFNKAQQDALLGSVEKGELLLIGATTENPSFEVISALLSRCQVYPLHALGQPELEQILSRAMTEDAFLAQFQIEIADPTLIYLYAGGDARIMLNRFEMAVRLASGKTQGKQLHITRELLQQVFQNRSLRYDKAGEEHYNLASAFIKSIRGSDPDAAVYWMARMLEAGEDPKFIARRLIIVASEDIGNAEPYALMLATSSFDAVHFIGMPEARIVLAQVTTYLASCPKSNAAYMAGEAALEDARKYQELPVPLHLRNAPTRMMKQFGYGRGYQYSHDFAGHFSEQQYLPDRLREKIYYQPSAQGREKALRDRLQHLWPQRRKPIPPEES